MLAHCDNIATMSTMSTMATMQIPDTPINAILYLIYINKKTVSFDPRTFSKNANFFNKVKPKFHY